MSLFAPVLAIGAGKMGGAILTAWLGAEDRDLLTCSDLYVQDPSPPAETRELLAKYNVEITAVADLPKPPELVMVGVKPQIITPVLEELAPRLDGESLVLSVAAGKTLEDLARSLPAKTPIVRAMPNTPIMVQAGMCALIGNEHVSTKQRDLLDQLLAPTGSVAWLEQEQHMDAVTALSGSGPAYLFWLTQCMVEAGIKAGLDEELALTLAKNTVYGAGKLMMHSELPPQTLRENVTSKGGTTAAALDVLMDESGLEPLIRSAIEAAVKRSKELSG